MLIAVKLNFVLKRVVVSADLFCVSLIKLLRMLYTTASTSSVLPAPTFYGDIIFKSLSISPPSIS